MVLADGRALNRKASGHSELGEAWADLTFLTHPPNQPPREVICGKKIHQNFRFAQNALKRREKWFFIVLRKINFSKNLDFFPANYPPRWFGGHRRQYQRSPCNILGGVYFLNLIARTYRSRDIGKNGENGHFWTFWGLLGLTLSNLKVEPLLCPWTDSNETL